MKKSLKIIFGVLLVLIAGAAIAWFGFLKPAPPPISPEDRAQIRLMPLPAELSLGNDQFLISKDLGHEFQGITSERLEKALGRFYQRLSKQSNLDLLEGNQKQLLINAQSETSQYPNGSEDESYSLSINSNQIILNAPSEIGVLHGLESLLQLVENEDDKWFFPEMEVKDNPRYPWRGIMIDVCRHWIPKEVILRNLDAMAAVKMNVLHWHLTEYQGFRVESKVFPKLHEMGSNGDYYTQEEIKEVIDYAADRGIRVIPEFDLPGHATAWFVGHPELASAPGPYVTDTVMGILFPLLDPTREEVYDFLDTFFEEMANLFPDEYIHIGGDEINPTHWNESADIQQFIKENNLEDHHGLQVYFNRKIQKIFAKHGKKMLGWDEILHPNLPKEGIIVQSWRNHESLWDAARGGNQAILSSGYYLDHQQPAEFHYNTDPTIIPNAVTIEVDSNNWKSWHCKMQFRDMEFEGDLYLFGEGEELRGIMKSALGTVGFEEAKLDGKSLKFTVDGAFGELTYDLILEEDSVRGEISMAVFTVNLIGGRTGGADMENGEPLPEFAKIEPLTPEQETNLLGGEACIWSEMVDGRTIDSRIWPRAASIAEKLWSPKEMTTDVKDMYRRLMVIDDYVALLGIQHKTNQEEILQELMDETYSFELRILVDALQEQKMFGRIPMYEPVFSMNMPLNRVVDAAMPESYIAYQFGQDVDLWIESKDEMAKSRITKQLTIWAINHQILQPAFDSIEKLKEVEKHSQNLSQLASVAIGTINDSVSLSSEEINQIIEAGNQPHGGTYLAVTIHIQKLIQN